MAEAASPASARVADTLPPLTVGPVTRHMLALYCGASGDHNPMHVDIDFARRAGMEDVFAHGMLSMAWLGRLVTDWAGPERLRSYGVRFTAITNVHDTVTCTGTVTAIETVGGEERLTLDLKAAKADGTPTLLGSAVVAR